jgi:hypothetical protein
MSALLLAAVLAAPAARPAPPQCPDRAVATLELGGQDAPTRLHAFFDPAAGGALGIFAELRRMVAERPDELGVSVWLVRPLAAFDPRMDRVRRFAWAAARAGHLDDALTVIARLGSDHIAATLLDDGRMQTLAPSLHLEPTALVTALAEGCDGARLDLASAQVARLGRGATLGLVRLPAFAIGGFVFDDTPGLERVRPELGREPVRRSLRWRAATTPGPPPPPVRVDRMRRPPSGGLVLGGLGLPHHLAVMGQGEDDPTLFLSLPRAMQYRSEHPGRLAVHILARGNGFGANVLRARLCAATRLGRELDYARMLAGPPDARRDPDAAAVELLKLLDAESDAHCGDTGQPEADVLPEGAWLDGVPRSPTELDDLPNLLRPSVAGTRPLDGFLRPGAAEP